MSNCWSAVGVISQVIGVWETRWACGAPLAAPKFSVNMRLQAPAPGLYAGGKPRVCQCEQMSRLIIIIIIIIIIIMMMMMMMMMMMLMMMMMIAFKGAVRDLYNLLAVPRTVSNTYAQMAKAQITCKTSSAHHVQRVVCHLLRRNSSAIKFDS